ncbi:MAG: hypothetical protein M1839_003010 [Geoglossum umbratile]|nr:MAG: hypothetical protein M1839_003010 [Geoglossum umbratile]
MSDTTPANSTSTIPTDTTSPARIILRICPIPSSPYEDHKYTEYANALLLHRGHREIITNYTTPHFVHVQPSSGIHPWHIIIDLQKDKFDGLDFDQLPHEIYKVKRLETGLHFHLRDPTKYARFYSKVRPHSDRYTWGK